MAISIVTTKLDKTNFIPEFVNIINNNNDQIKSALEDLYNKLFINVSNIDDNSTSGGVIGETKPLSSITSNFLVLKTGADVGNGISITNLSNVEIGYIKNVAGKCIAMFDNVIIKESTTTFLEKQVIANVIGATAIASIALSETDVQEMIVNIKLPLTAYNSSYIVNEIDVDLSYDNGVPALNGQNFTITLGKILDSNGTEITSVLPSGGIKLTSSVFLNKTPQNTSLNLILAPGSADYTSNYCYNKTINVKCLTLTSDTPKLLIKNIS